MSWEQSHEFELFLGIDTCGTVGSVALAALNLGEFVLMGERTIPGGELSLGLVREISELLTEVSSGVADLEGIAVVTGPGSFTGIRLGLAAVKAFAESARLPVVTVSRLALLAERAQAPCAVLDAHRGQFYCGMYGPRDSHPTNPIDAREMLLTAGEINAMGGLSGRVAVCEETVAQFLEELFGEPEIVRVVAPTAFDALNFSTKKWRAEDFSDVATLDGYYLRGADAKVATSSGSPLG